MELQNLIGGEMMNSESGNWLENVEPATGKIFSRIPRSGAADVEAAVQAARKAFPGWSSTPFEERAACLRRLGALIATHSEALIAAESQDNGKPVSLARAVDIPRAQKNLEFFAGAIEHFASEVHIPGGSEFIHYTHRKPIGVVGCISPWNLPLYLFTWKIAPALAAGNCVVAKPSEVTPVTAWMLSEWIAEAGFPSGAFNVIHGLGGEAGRALVEHPLVKAISFTGGTQTGAEITRTTAGMFKKLSLELGGKNPAIVFADCDLEKAVATTIRSSFANQGQICLCSSRVLIEDSLYETFRDALVNKAKRIRPGDPSDPTTKMGALVSAEHRDKVLGYIKSAVGQGATVLCGGGAAPAPNDRCKSGYFVQPTILEGLGPECNINQEEIFGPVITLQRFFSETEAIALANDSVYGLAATIWTENLSKAHRVAGLVESGIAWINCWLVRDLRTPFGGVKSSGVGREGGFEALRFFTEPQSVCVPTN